jgi:hypothetical protein
MVTNLVVRKSFKNPFTCDSTSPGGCPTLAREAQDSSRRRHQQRGSIPLPETSREPLKTAIRKRDVVEPVAADLPGRETYAIARTRRWQEAYGLSPVGFVEPHAAPSASLFPCVPSGTSEHSRWLAMARASEVVRSGGGGFMGIRPR